MGKEAGSASRVKQPDEELGSSTSKVPTELPLPMRDKNRSRPFAIISMPVISTTVLHGTLAHAHSA